MNVTVPVRTTLVVLAIAAATALPAGYLLRSWAGPRNTGGAALGAGLATVSTLAGVWLIAWAFDKPQKVFLATLAGGFLGRMALFGGALAVVILATDLSPAAFLGGLFGYYVLDQALVIRAVHRAAGAAGRDLSPARRPR